MTQKSAFFLILILATIWDACAREEHLPVKIFVSPFKCIKQPEILVSENEITKLFLEKIGTVDYFEIQFVAKESSVNFQSFSDIFLSGKYEVDQDLFSIDYQLKSGQIQNRYQGSIKRMEMREIQEEFFSRITGLYISAAIRSQPTEANLRIDGFLIGKTPCTLSHILAGIHSIALEKPDYFGLVQDVEIAQNDSLFFELKPRGNLLDYKPPRPKNGINAIIEKIGFTGEPPRGQVIILVVVDKNGKVVNTKVEQSLGKKELDQAIISSIKAVKWIPAKLGKENTDGSTKIILKF